jgi:hypothetical protein
VNPILVETVGSINLVRWQGRIWAVPQALGPLDIDNQDHRGRPGIVQYEDLSTARRSLGVPDAPVPAAPLASPAPAPYLAGQRWPVTWWLHTGEHGPWRNHDGKTVSDGDEDASYRSPIYESAAGERREGLEELPIGALWTENGDYYQAGPDGHAVSCKCPNQSRSSWTVWHIDGRASNCTSACAKCGVPYRDHRTDCQYQDSAPQHRCWSRRGTIGEPINVDKSGETCKAGGGSIQTDGWHGNLHNGVLFTS